MPSPLPPPPGFVAPHIRRGRYIFPDPTAGRALALVCAGYEECGPDFFVDRPSFRWHAVELLDRGAWEERDGGAWVPATAGTVVFYGPGRAGGIRATGNGPHAKYFADFRGTPARRLLRMTGLSAQPVRRLADGQGVASLYEQLLSCVSLPSDRQANVASSLLAALLARIGAEPDAVQRSAAQRRNVFERCREYLAANYTTIRSPGEAARACHVGPEYFCRLFREHTGQTPSQFMARLRMHHAAKLLLRSDDTVKSIGRTVGFDDPYHFSRVFKQIHGVAPRHFRFGGAPSGQRKR